MLKQWFKNFHDTTGASDGYDAIERRSKGRGGQKYGGSGGGARCVTFQPCSIIQYAPVKLLIISTSFGLLVHPYYPASKCKSALNWIMYLFIYGILKLFHRGSRFIWGTFPCTTKQSKTVKHTSVGALFWNMFLNSVWYCVDILGTRKLSGWSLWATRVALPCLSRRCTATRRCWVERVLDAQNYNL